MRIPALLVTAMICAFAASPSLAVSEGAPSIYQPLLITSARAAALGGTTVVIEESGISGWRNPGFLAFDRKLRATGTYTQLVPDLADDIELRSLLVSVPSGVVLPVAISLGYAKLDFGESTIINDDGTEGRSFESYDRALNLSAAIELWETVGLGVTLEHVYSKLSDPIPELNIADGDADAFGVSLGAGARRRFAFPLGTKERADLVITPLAGISLLHWGGDLAYNDEDDPEEMARHLHLGAGLRIAHEPRFVEKFFDPARFTHISVAGYIERATPEVDSNPIVIAKRGRVGPASPAQNDDDEERIMHYGCEITISGLLSYRFGHVDDPDGDITDETHGWGIGVEDVLPFDVRLDYASFPQASGLDRVERWDVMISFDPRFLNGD